LKARRFDLADGPEEIGMLQLPAVLLAPE
jgi:hypothetical protein